MSDRIRHVKHHGKPIMDVDFTNCSAEEMLTVLDELQRQIAKHAPNTVLAIADYSGAEVNKAVATRIKEVLVLDKPFVKRAAWIGAESVPKVYYENFKTFSRRDIPTFTSREEALDWLVSSE